MIRGTTPELTFTLPFDVTDAMEIWLTFSQRGREVFTVEKEDLEINGDVVKCVLTQRQTLSLRDGSYVEMQFRVLFDNGDRGDALASDIISAPVKRILKEGVIRR